VSRALVIGLPFATLEMPADPLPQQMPSPKGWMAFAYVWVFNMFLRFFAWDQGLTLGGMARAEQVISLPSAGESRS